MTKYQKYFSALLTLLFGGAVLLFFGLAYPYHIHYQEQYQLFEWTGAYFLDIFRAPGGLADWLGRFLTQFFYYAWAGAAILAVLLVAVQLLVWKLCSEKNLVTYVFSLVPSVALWVALLDENILPGAVVAVILSLAAAAAVLALKRRTMRRAVGLLAVPLLYWLCGPLAVVYVGVVAFRERKLWFPVASVLLLAACPFVAQLLCAYPLERLVIGVHYHRFRNIFALRVFVSAALCIAVVAVSAARWPDSRARTDWWVGAGVAAFIGALAAGLVVGLGNSLLEEQMKYDFLLRMKMYNRLMMTSDRKQPSTPFAVACLNVALAHSDRMSSSMFEYFQNGPDGLLPEFKREYFVPLATAEAYWEMGMVNTAQRFVFEAQEAIPDYQKSGRCYRRLAETNIVNGDYAVARKYLYALENTIFYRKWARETLGLLDAGSPEAVEAAVNSHPEYGRMRSLRLHDHDFFFSDSEMDSMLGLLLVENPANRAAFDYLLGWCLLKKDLGRFLQCLQLVNYSVMPKAYQEACVLQMALSQPDASGVPPFIDRRIVGAMEQFVADSRAGRDESWMSARYGRTYWFYYFYRYK